MVLSSAIVCDHDRRIADDRRSMFPYDRRRSQTLLRSAICDPRSNGDQPLCSIFCDRLRSSAIMIAGSQTIAEVCFHMIADDRRRSQTLLRSAICDPRSYGNQPLLVSKAFENSILVEISRALIFLQRPNISMPGTLHNKLIWVIRRVRPSILDDFLSHFLL